MAFILFYMNIVSWAKDKGALKFSFYSKGGKFNGPKRFGGSIHIVHIDNTEFSKSP